MLGRIRIWGAIGATEEIKDVQNYAVNDGVHLDEEELESDEELEEEDEAEEALGLVFGGILSFCI